MRSPQARVPPCKHCLTRNAANEEQRAPVEEEVASE